MSLDYAGMYVAHSSPDCGLQASQQVRDRSGVKGSKQFYETYQF